MEAQARELRRHQRERKGIGSERAEGGLWRKGVGGG